MIICGEEEDVWNCSRVTESVMRSEERLVVSNKSKMGDESA